MSHDVNDVFMIISYYEMVTQLTVIWLGFLANFLVYFSLNGDCTHTQSCF